MNAREFDVILWGATGFTGRLVAEYLLVNHPKVKLALGGRNAAKLDEVKRELAAFGDASAIPTIVADPASASAMDGVVARARVVASTAGPFNAYGRELVSACARAGTHYVDITGEPTFVRFAIDRLDDVARASGARIVSCCGFDSIPSDLGVLVAHEALQARGSELRSAELVVVHMDGAASGGTIASAMLLMEEAAKDASVRALLEDPYALDPPGGPRSPDARDVYDARFVPEVGKWTAPFMMRVINARIVRRTNALLGYAYGEGFRYDERVAVGRGAMGRARATAMALGMRVGTPMLRVGPIRRFAQRFLPPPGSGPSRAKRDRGSFEIRILATGRAGESVTVTVRGVKDPGYAETAKMLSESALALAQDEAQLPKRAGVLTPATGMGMPLVERLRRAGMTFAVE